MALDYLSLLNEPQRAAVLHTDGPTMIIAGAGSGKTRVLTYRIAHLLEKGVDPFNILSLTFTNKAAKEMRARIEKVVGPAAKGLWMGTFHSVFARILRSEADKLGYPRHFTIYDTDDTRTLMRQLLKELNLDDKVYKPAAVLGRISAAKNKLISVQQYLSDAQIRKDDEVAQRPRYRPALPDVPAALLPGRRDGLRRPAVPDQRAVPRPRGCAQQIPAPVQVRDGGRVPGHQLLAVPDYAQAGGFLAQHLRGGRRCAEHLRFPRRRHYQHSQLRARLPRAAGLSP